MAIKHSAVKATGDKGYASEWNADHVIGTGTIINSDISTTAQSRRAATLIVAAYNSNDLLRADYVCDGTNDEVILQAAINALPASGGKIILMEGDYYLDDVLTVAKSNVVIEGQGRSTKFLTNTGSEEIRLGDNITTYYGIEVSGLSFDFSGSPGFNVRKINNSVIHDVYCEGSDSALTVAGCNGFTFRDSRITFTEVVITNSDGCQIENIVFTNGGFVSLNSTCDSNVIRDVKTPFNNQQLYITCAGTNNLISGCKLYVDDGNLITLTGSGNQVIGNVLYGSTNGYDGILVNGGDNNSIVGNYIRNMNRDGIHLQSTATRNMVEGNYITGCTGYGIREAAAADNRNIFLGNVVHANTAGQISVAGANTISDHNVVT